MNGGGTLNLKPGTYILHSDIQLPSGIVLNGSGPTNTLIIGAIGYAIKGVGTSGSHLVDVGVSNLGIYNGTVGAALDFAYIDRLILNNVVSAQNQKGLLVNHCTQVNWRTVIATQNISDGITATDVLLLDWESVNAEANGGDGLVLDTATTLSAIACDFAGNTGNGISISNSSQLDFLVSASSNGGHGIELKQGNSNIIVFNVGVAGNIGDGIKLTDSSSACKITTGSLASNGGYGVNIVNAACASNIILGNIFDSNSSGAVNDSGTGTLIRSNVGVADN